MPGRASLLELARQLRAEMNSTNLAFKRLTRAEFTERLRKLSGEEGARIRSTASQDIERALQEQGIRIFPRLAEVTAGDDEVRLFRAGTVAANLLDVLLNPSNGTDQELIEITKKIKGMWKWSIPEKEVSSE